LGLCRRKPGSFGDRSGTLGVYHYIWPSSPDT
jgi:hypothetical protein